MRAVMRIVLVFVALITLGFVAACGGGNGIPDDHPIPDDVEWTVLGERPGFRDGWNYYLKVNKPVSDDVLRAIGENHKWKHQRAEPAFNPEWGSVVVWFYLPDDKPPYDNAGAWRTVRLNPDGIEIDKRSY